jgi:cytochrome c553
MTRSLCSFVLVLAAAGCAGPRATQRHMNVHFQRVAEIEAALIRGDLDGARNAATYMADHEEAAGLPDAGQPWLSAMRAEARATAAAGDITVAAGAAGRMIKTCGDCHHATGHGPAILVGRLPDEGGSATRTEMTQHQWAADRMRDGLIGPSDVAWAAGAVALSNDPIYQAEVAVRTGRFQQMEDMARRSVELGRRAVALRDGFERAAAYGEFIASCAACHRAIGVLQQPPR